MEENHAIYKESIYSIDTDDPVNNREITLLLTKSSLQAICCGRFTSSACMNAMDKRVLDLLVSCRSVYPDAEVTLWF